MTVIERVNQAIQGKILSNEWKPGQRLPSEAEMCRLFGVSRATVRTSIQHFCQMGIMETIKGSGTFLRSGADAIAPENTVNLLPVDGESMLYLLEIRLPLESQAAYFAATRHSVAQLEKLQKELRDLMKAEDPLAFAKADEKFHRQVVEMCGNPILVRLYHTLQTYTSHAFIEQTVSLNNTIHNLDYDAHARIFEAIRKKDSAEARVVSSRHIQDTIDRVQQQIIEL